MIPLLFILIVTGLSILVSCHFSPEITWLTYYIGGMIGLFISGISLDFWNRRNRRYEDVIIIRREMKGFGYIIKSSIKLCESWLKTGVRRHTFAVLQKSKHIVDFSTAAING